mgnify:CR=1 FL=1
MSPLESDCRNENLQASGETGSDTSQIFHVIKHDHNPVSPFVLLDGFTPNFGHEMKGFVLILPMLDFKHRSGDHLNVKIASIGFNFRHISIWLKALVSWFTLLI